MGESKISFRSNFAFFWNIVLIAWIILNHIALYWVVSRERSKSESNMTAVLSIPLNSERTGSLLCRFAREQIRIDVASSTKKERWCLCHLSPRVSLLEKIIKNSRLGNLCQNLSWTSVYYQFAHFHIISCAIFSNNVCLLRGEFQLTELWSNRRFRIFGSNENAGRLFRAAKGFRLWPVSKFPSHNLARMKYCHNNSLPA